MSQVRKKATGKEPSATKATGKETSEREKTTKEKKAPSRIRRLKAEIIWPKVEHIRVSLDGNEKLKLEIKTTEEPLPYVTIVTHLTDLVLFQTCLWSWNNFAYPKELLNWIILDPEKRLKDSLNDSRVRVLTSKVGKYSVRMRELMEMPWISMTEEPTKDVTTDYHRKKVWMSLECGDVCFPDTLSLKHRVLATTRKDCVVPDSLAYYQIFNNASIVYKLYVQLPRSGLYWKKEWWRAQSSDRMIGMPYIGNCVTISTGPPPFRALPQPSSVRLFDNLPQEMKELVKKTRLVALTSLDDSDSDDEGDSDSDDVGDGDSDSSYDKATIPFHSA